MPLTDVQVRNLSGGQKPVKPSNEKSESPKVSKPKNTTKGVGATLAKTDDEPKFIVTTKPYKMADGAGLYLEVDPSGGKYWRFKYRRTGKEKRISLGVYPEVSLANARKARDGCREQLAKGIDPGVARKAQAAAQSSGDANSFEVVAREWLKEHVDPKSESHSKRVYARFENDVFPQLRGRPIAEITAKELLIVIRKIENRDAKDTAHRTTITVCTDDHCAIRDPRAAARLAENPAPTMLPALEAETDEQAEERKQQHEQERKEYEAGQERRAEAFREQRKREEQEYEAEQARREEQRKCRAVTFERILESAPASFTTTQLRVLLRAIVNLDPYTFAGDLAEYITGDNENEQRSAEEILLSTIDATADDKLTCFVLRHVLAGHIGIPREGKFDFLTEAEAAFVPLPTKMAKESKPRKLTRAKVTVGKPVAESADTKTKSPNQPAAKASSSKQKKAA